MSAALSGWPVDGLAAIAKAPGAGRVLAASSTSPTPSTTLGLGRGGVVGAGIVAVGTPGAAVEPELRHGRLLYDPRFDDITPAAVAYCASPADVQRCVAFARAHGITPVPRCGGHSYAGYSTGPGSSIDVTP